MNREIMTDILPVFMALILGGGVLAVGARYPPAKKIGRRRVFEGMLKKHRNNTGLRYELENWLEKYGAKYHYGRSISAGKLVVASLMIMAAGWIVGMRVAMYVGFIAGVSGLLLPWLLLPVMNRLDNERMLSDIRLVYHALATQIRAGVYVADALAEMYSGVENQRLKEALLDLGGDIVLKADMLSALERFQRRFDNRYIDSLCITVIQAMESGQAVELLSDIAEQVKDMEKAVLEKKKGKLDRSITFYQLGMLSCVLAVAIYACINHMLSSALSI